MSLVYAALSPHPPLLVPEVGGARVEDVKKSADALYKMSEELINKKPDTLIMITPHGPVFRNEICMLADDDISGDLSQFGAGDVMMRFDIDKALALKIYEEASKNNFEMIFLDKKTAKDNFIPYSIDHALMVPLYYLKEKGFNAKILPMTMAFWDYKKLFDFGKIISGVIQKSGEKIALLTSGDLSHRLIPDAPAGYSKRGKEFDELIVKYLGEYKVDKILNIDEDLVEQAGECGLRPIMIMLGILSGFKVTPKVLSYEGPFGVGYAVIKFDVI